MINLIMEELQALADDKTKAKYIKDGCDTEVYGVKIGELKKLVKKHKINNNNEIAIELIETKNYDAMYLGFLIMKPSGIDKELFIKWSTYSKYYRIMIHSLAYGMAEHSEYQWFIDYFKDGEEDYMGAIYYAILAGRVVIDPEYNNQELEQVAYYINDHVNSLEYSSKEMTKVEMHTLIGYIGMQVASLSDQMIEIANNIQPDFEVSLNRRIANNAGFIKSCIERDGIGKKRKSARC